MASSAVGTVTNDPPSGLLCVAGESPIEALCVAHGTTSKHIEKQRTGPRLATLSPSRPRTRCMAPYHTYNELNTSSHKIVPPAPRPSQMARLMSTSTHKSMLLKNPYQCLATRKVYKNKTNQEQNKPGTKQTKM